MNKTHSYTDDDIRDVAKKCFSVNGMLPLLGLAQWCGNWRTIKRKIESLGIDVSHFTGKSHMKGKRNPRVPKIDLNDILIEDSTYHNTTSLKARLMSNGLIRNECYECGQDAMWMGVKLVMVLDHINGNHSDNRIVNLRLLCPNCNSQQDTFCGKNAKSNRTRDWPNGSGISLPS